MMSRPLAPSAIADADLLAALADDERRDAVQAHDRQPERDARERTRQRRQRTRLGELFAAARR